jgi:hypothetical protein
MGIRHWIRKKTSEQAEDGEEDRAPSTSIFNAIFGREAPTLHALGEYDQKTYPGELQDLLRRREEVAEELREMDLTTRRSRIDAIPRLQLMLRTYPHPLAYETLIHAYVDAGRWDEARGAAFAARERRTQVSRSPYSEIRSEIDRLKEWTPQEVDLVRQEREGSAAPVTTATATEAAVSPVEQAAREQLTEPVRKEEEVEAVIQEVSERPVEPVEPEATADVTDTDSAADVGDPVDSADVSEPVVLAEPVESPAPVESAGAADRIESEFVDPDETGDSDDGADADDGSSAESPGTTGAANSGTSGGANGAARRRNSKNRKRSRRK